ncbi:type VII secretion target [Mycobacterium sp. ZZG]
MPAPLSVDTDSIREYGAACSVHAAHLDTAAARLTAAAGAAAPLLGPVGARFLAALARAAEDQALLLTTVSRSLEAGDAAASEAAHAYAGSDDAAASRITGGR